MADTNGTTTAGYDAAYQVTDVTRTATRLLTLVVATVVVGIPAACLGVHKDIGVTYENRTAVDLFGDINGGGFEKIEAGETETIDHRLSGDERNDIEITVKTEAGGIVYHKVFSNKKELEEATGMRIVLEDPLATVAPPTR